MQTVVLFNPQDSRLSFDALDVKLPLRRSKECIATVVDADGRDLLTVDVNNTRADADVEAITSLIINIINGSAGLFPGIRHVTTERTS